MKKSTLWKSAAAVAAVAAGTAGVITWLSAATAFVPADAPSGFMGQLEVTNFNLSSGSEFIFKTDFEKEHYTGNLYAYPVSAAGVLNKSGEVFSGGVKAHLDAQDFDTERFIVTMNSSGVGVPFRYPASVTASTISATQKTAVGSQEVLNFVRGDRTNESVGLGYRSRNAVLGDIIHSRPFYVKYGGTSVIYVGANDGMLHAFDAGGSGGDELWAYVPSMLFSKLPALTTSPYVHTYFVDGGLNVADVTISGATKKILVSGLGAGGQGLFALDVTAPPSATEASAATKVMWEITSTTINNATSNVYANLGYTYGTPVITKVNSNSGESAVIIGNGYNSSAASSPSTLYVINPSNGSLIKAIATSGSNGGGLSTPACYDATGDGRVDYCYAGDIDGKLWKFNLSDTNTTLWTASLLHTTSPAQAITMAPSLSTHPSGGVMVNFGTGKMFLTTDKDDSSVFYAYGIWDGAPSANLILLAQTLTERSFTLAGVTSRVRTSTANAPTWTSGTGNHRGWRVALPAGERIIGDTVFTESGRFYFNSYNPTIDNSALTPATPNGENWLMELDYLTGGVVNSPFLDMNSDQLLTNLDRIVYKASDTKPAGSVNGDPIMTTDGIPVGKFITNGISSHPLLVQLATLNTTLLNQNPDVDIVSTPTERGVIGGHFDIDVWYHGGPNNTGHNEVDDVSGSTQDPVTTPNICHYRNPVAAAQPSITITVTSTGVAQPASLGAIKVSVGGVTTIIANPLTSSDLVDGTATSTNAGTIEAAIDALTSSTGYSASKSSNVVTIKAPAGTSLNGATLIVDAGTSFGAVGPNGNPTGTFTLSNATSTSKTISSIKCGTTETMSSAASTGSGSSAAARINNLGTALNGQTKNGYSWSCTGTNKANCTLTGPVGAADCNKLTVTKDSSITISPAGTSGSPIPFTGGSDGSAGQSDLKPKLTIGNSSLFSGGTAATPGTLERCSRYKHEHQYDDVYNVTGVNMLNASDPAMNISLAMGTSQQFKVLVQNQYLSPAVTLSVGGAAHVSVKTYNNQATETSAANVIANAPAYTRDTITSLEYNMPTDAFDQKDWWGSGDTRVGLHPTKYSCVYELEYDYSSGNYTAKTSGTLFYPVVPKTNGVDGPGTLGTTTGARKNGALTIQAIRADTPASSIELNVASRPEYGWRVKQADYETYVLAEWSTYWHHPNGKCYHSSGWTKLAPKDLVGSNPDDWAPPAPNSDDPATGSFRATSAIAIVATTVSGNVTTTVTTYADGTKLTVVKTVNTDGTTTITTTVPDGTVTSVTVANTAGTITTGGDEKGTQAKTGRISWSERLRN